jgi:Flp pilus assembly protein TadD
VHYELGLVLRQRGELDKAAGEFRQAIELSPSDGPSFLNLAQILGLQGKTAESQEVMRKFGEVRKNREAARQALLDNDTAIGLVERGELKAGIDHFRAALGLRPEDSELHRNLALALYRVGELGEARKEYETAIRLNPHDWQAHCGLGEVLAKQNHLAESIKEVENAVQLNPNYAEAYQLLNRLYRQANSPANAAAALARAQSLAVDTNPRK